MELGVYTAAFRLWPLERTLDRIADLGVSAVEIATGNFGGDNHCKPHHLLEDPVSLEKFRLLFDQRGLKIAALNCSGNPLHPKPEIAEWHRQTLRMTIVLAERLGVPCVVTMSGCPGDGPGARIPNWVVYPWPQEFLEVLRWQWDEVASPFWRDMERFARERGVRLALEMHPGMLVYNPETLLQLRALTGPNLGANLDPSHLWWQGIDPGQAIRQLGDVIFHVHAKDCVLDPWRIAENGVLDLHPYSSIAERRWNFRTVGYGHGEQEWRRLVSTLRMTGYDGVLCIEHEDALADPEEGLQRAVTFLRNCILERPPGALTWV